MPYICTTKEKTINMLHISNLKTLQNLFEAFPDEEACINYLETIRWAGNVVSPFDPSSKIYKCAGNKYKCKNTRKYFNVLTGTIFENTKIPLRKWFTAFYLLMNRNKGISSCELASMIDVTVKTSWFLLSRIRYIMNHDSFIGNLNGSIELDESYIGGKNKNRHNHKKIKGSQGRSSEDKQPVFGMFQNEISEIIYRPNKNNSELAVKEKVIHQHAMVRTEVVADTKKATLIPIVKEKVELDSIVTTDEYPLYKSLRDEYNHVVVYHRLNNYVVSGGFTTNHIEGYWNILKKVWGTTYMGRITPKHLHRYCRETDYRFNTRHLLPVDKFNLLIQGAGKRLRYTDLINNK